MSTTDGRRQSTTSSVTLGSQIDGLPAPTGSLKYEGSLASLDPNSTVPPLDFVMARTLVLCFDGTGDHFDRDNTNVVNFFTALSKGNTERQMVYYQAGIGTYGGINIFTRTSELLDKAIAWNLRTHVTDGYEFLMQNYRDGDKICIFGFSRGAYTARCLAGMLHKVGLLPTCNHQQVPFAYDMYATDTDEGWTQSNAFKKAFSIDVNIEFIGVWDTVNSVGIIPHHLPFTNSNTVVRFFRHAVALDERRAKFKANMCKRLTAKENTFCVEEHKAHGSQAEAPEGGPILLAPTDVKEVWFAGCHCDVGGGSVSNDTSYSLARIPLRWMIRQCFETGTGIMFKTEELRKLGMMPNSLHPAVLPRPPALSPGPLDFIKRALPTSRVVDTKDDPYKLSEEEHELKDALSAKYDQLELTYTWRLGEYWPMRREETDDKGEKKSRWFINRWGGRDIPEPREPEEKVKVHRSVKTRMAATFKDKDRTHYAPEVTNLDLTKVEWVE